MALVSITYTTLQNACAHATGVTTPDTGASWADVVNESLYELVTRKAWSWRRRALSLNLVQGQSYVDLPADFGELWSLAGPAGTTSTGIVPITLSEMAVLRQLAGSTAQRLCVALSYVAQASATVAPTARLELFPTPTAAVTAGITGFYLYVPAKMSGSTDVPDIPPEYSRALRLLCRANAIEEQTQQQDSPDRVAAERLIEQLAKRDALTQPVGGRVIGTVDMQMATQLRFSDARFFPTGGVTVS